MRLRYSLILSLAAMFALATAPFADTGLVALLNQAQENPPTGSPATGNGVVVINAAQTQFSYTVNYTGLLAGVTANHVHKAPVGVNGPVVYAINQNIGSFSGTLAGNFTFLATSTPAEMIASQNYFNIHTSQFPGGEIRGQILLEPTATRSTSWSRIKQLYR